MNEGNTSPGSVSIRFLSGPLAGQTLSISKPVMTIGRDATNDIVVKGDQKVSRSHARLMWNNGFWHIEKLAPQNILTVNHQQVQQASISDNTTIGLGEDTSFLFLVRATGQAAPQPSMSAQHVSSPYQPVAPPYTPLPQHQPYAGVPQQQYQASSPASQHYPPAPPQPYQLGPQQRQFPAGQTTGLGARPDETQIASPTSLGVPTLEVSSNIFGARQAYSLTNDVISIGRDTTNDIVIRDGGIVSGQHLQIIRQDNQFVLLHPHPDKPRTLNGLLYQGRKIRGDEPFRKTLTRGDIFRIGDEHGTLITLAFNDGTGKQEDTLVPMQPIKLEASELTIGRVQGNTVVLPHPQVSAHHARLVKEGGTYRILDMNSTNHVYVNSELTTNRLLKLGDEIRIGPYKLVYETNELKQYDESNFIRIDALNGLRPAQSGKVLYNGQDYYKNLAAFSSQLGYVPQDDIVHRDLTVERALYYAAKLRLPSDFTPPQIKQRINEVLEDVEMTARRKLLVKKLSGGQRKRVSIALELLANPSLFFLDEPTSGLDPGLDRKMMFLLRKLADKGHTIVLVTHATNNINTCDYVCFLCQGGRLAFYGPPEEAKKYFGKTDFAEIYSSLEPTEENPSIPEEAAARFKVSAQYQEYVLAPLRSGPASRINEQAAVQPVKRPRRGNPLSQFLLLTRRNVELLRNDRSTLLIMLLQAPLIALFLMLLIRFEVGAGVFDPGHVVQCAPQIFTSTAVSQTNPTGALGINPTAKQKNDNGTVNCNLIQNFLATDASGKAYVQTKTGNNKQAEALQDFIVLGDSINAQRTLFLAAFIAVLFGVINAIREIVKEGAIYRRERTVNLGIAPYLSSKILMLGVLALFQSGVLILIIYAFEPLHQGIFLPILLECYITLALTSIAGLMIGLTVSALAPNEDSATSLLPIILIPQVIFAGVEIPLKDGLTTTLAWFFPTRWAMAGLGSSLGLHADKLGGDKLYGSDPTYHGTLFSIYSQSDATHRLLLAWGVLGATFLVLAILAGIILKRKDIRK